MRRDARLLVAVDATLLAAGAFILAIGIVMLLRPSLGRLSVNVAEYGPAATETPQVLRDPSGAIVYPGFPPTICTSSRSTPWATSGSGTFHGVDASRI